MDLLIRPEQFREVVAEVPDSIEGLLDRAFLGKALSHLAPDRSTVSEVVLNDTVQAMAAKVRIALSFESRPQDYFHLCLKGFIGNDVSDIAAQHTTFREAGFYSQIAPVLGMRSPPCAAVIRNDSFSRCIIVLTDLIHDGAHFFNALEPLGVDQVAQTLEQLAILHAAQNLLKGRQWLPVRLKDLTENPRLDRVRIQANMEDGRGAGLQALTLQAEQLQRGLEKLVVNVRSLQPTVLHGDCHPGNIYRDTAGLMTFTDWQLIQKGHWSLDVAYHIASSLPVTVAEGEERHLLKHYRQALKAYGGEVEPSDVVERLYAQALVYGYYHWAITSRVEPAITRETFFRLGSALERNDSYRRLAG